MSYIRTAKTYQPLKFYYYGKTRKNEFDSLGTSDAGPSRPGQGDHSAALPRRRQCQSGQQPDTGQQGNQEIVTTDPTTKNQPAFYQKRDSLFIANDIQNTTYEFGDSVTEENKTLVKGLFERMAKNQPEKSAFKIIEVDEKMLNLEKNGQITTYVRTDSLNR